MLRRTTNQSATRQNCKQASETVLLFIRSALTSITIIPASCAGEAAAKVKKSCTYPCTVRLEGINIKEINSKGINDDVTATANVYIVSATTKSDHMVWDGFNRLAATGISGAATLFSSTPFSSTPFN